MIRITKILYATDVSPFSNQAYFHAVSLAQKHGAGLTVLFVYHPERTAAPGAPTEPEAARTYSRAELAQDALHLLGVLVAAPLGGGSGARGGPDRITRGSSETP